MVHRPSGVLEASAGTELSDAEREQIIEFALLSLRQTDANKPEPIDLSDFPVVRGYDLERPFMLEDFVASLLTTGFQATALGRAIAILREVRERRVPLYLGVTSNIGTCGLREPLTYLVRHQHLRGLAATAGAIEEDVMKALGDFYIGDFRADDRQLFLGSVSRTGNIFIPGELYTRLHMLLLLLHKRLFTTVIAEQGSIGVVEYVRELGRQLEISQVPGRSGSVVYQAFCNGIDIYCPPLLDGAIGDAFYFAKRRYPEFVIDVSRCQGQLIEDMMLAAPDGRGVALMALGGSVSKHMLCNAAIYSGGARYAVYINTATESDGSNAGASPSEAISWGKLRSDASSVKIEAEATLVFPLLLAACFQTYSPAPNPAASESSEQRAPGVYKGDI